MSSGLLGKKNTISQEKREGNILESGKEIIEDLFGGKDSPISKKPQAFNESLPSSSKSKPQKENLFEEEQVEREEKKESMSPKKREKELEEENSFEREEKRESKALVPTQEPEAKTFVTQKREEEKQEAAWNLNDLLFPGGKIAKLCRITNPKSKDIKVSDILKRSGIIENNPVILLSGAEGDKRAGLLVGIARAAYSTDAVIVDNGLKSGIETACFRKKVKLVGVCPEEAIVYPTKSSTGDRLGELAAGHSHLVVMGTKGDGMRWDNVVPFKMELCERIRKGRGGPGSFLCRAVCVLVGDNTGCSWEVEKALKAGWPVLVIEASPMGRDVAAFIKGGHANIPKTLQEPLKKGKVFVFPESGTAEHLASAVHLHLAISF